MATRANSEGSVYQAKDGRWVGAMSLEDGRRKVYYGKTRTAVHTKLVAAQRELQRGITPVPEQETVASFLTRWLETTVTRSVRPRTLEGYSHLVKLHIAPAIGRHRIAKLTPQLVDNFLQEKLASGVGSRTVQYLHAVLRRALTIAERQGLVGRNVAKLVEPPRYRRPEVTPLTPDEARTFLAAARGDRNEALYSVALALGLRQGEALGLSWIDIDFEKRSLCVRVALQRLKGKGLTFVEPKTDRSRRTLPLPDAIVVALRAHRVRQLEERLAVGDLWRDVGVVFATPFGTPLDGQKVTLQFGALLKAAGLPHHRFHDLRHSCASLLLAQGVPLRVVMETLGHSQIALTANTYTHVLPVLQREAADKMNALFVTG